MIWKVSRPDDGTVCSLCQLKGEGSWHCSVRRQRWVWRIRWRGEISEPVFFTLGQSAPSQVLQVAARASALLPHSLCPTQLYKTHSYWQNVFSLKTSLDFLSKIPRKFTKNVLNKNSLQKLTSVPKAVLFWQLWICYTWRHCTNSGWGSFVSHLWFTVGTNVMGTLNQEHYLGWIFWGSGMWILVSQACCSSQGQFQNLHREYIVLSGRTVRAAQPSVWTHLVLSNTQALKAGELLYYFIYLWA